LESHFQKLDALNRLAQIIPSSHFTCYCWNYLRDAGELEQPEFQRLSQARILFENASVLLKSLNITQPYDWNGYPPDGICVVLELNYSYPLKEEDRTPSFSVTRLLAEIASEVLGETWEGSVKTTTLRRDGFRSHQYAITVPATHGVQLTRQLCNAFNLRNGLGSYEFCGTLAELDQIHRGGSYRFESFPEQCWSLNAPLNAPFALARQSFVRPIPNIEATKLPEVAAILDALGRNVSRVVVCRKYLSWNLSENAASPRTQGNFFLLSQQKMGYAMFVGFEQYADGDPSVTRFASAVAPAVERSGAALRKVSAIR
jgi:hypothetical protein